ncbi:MAG: terpene cyclase/mutase family protein [Methylococcales bacterium]|nr:terpene cyclase/mutase family protein [Methylococcales bacterium]
MLNIKPSWKNWTLLTKNGRQIWAFKPRSTDIEKHLDNVDDFSETERQQFTDDFSFDSHINPNSGDKVFRHQTHNKQYQDFSGARPTAKNADEQAAIDALINGINYFSHLQSDEGHWAGDYAGPLFLLPGLLIASYITETPFPKPHQALMEVYLFNHQNTDGGWGMHIEGDSTMFGTVIQYVSLRILGVDKDNSALIKARDWIHSHGGATGVPSWGKFYLSIMNIYHWDGVNSLFPEMWLFPKWLPVHPSRYWCHSRMVYLPMAYCYSHKIQAPENALILSLRQEIFTEDFSTINWPKQRNKVCQEDIYTTQSPALKWMNLFTNTYEKFHSSWFRKKATKYILDYIDAEDLQTQYINIGPVSQSINSICIWHAKGKQSKPFQQHVKRWYDYLWVAEDGMKMSGYNGSQLWDVSFTTRAILESDIAKQFQPTIEKSYHFIEKMQILEQHSTHEEFFRHPATGGWPFSTVEHSWPIADCTAEGLSTAFAIHHSGLVNPVINERRLKLAVDVLLSFQNKDGGWASYELTRAPKWLEKLNPSEIFADIMIDHSWTECTSGCVQTLLEAFKTFPDYKAEQIHSSIINGVNFIIQQQKQDGSWYGGWGVCFTYATWFAVETLSKVHASHISIDHIILDQALSKSCQFLLSKQKADGGWGETYESCVKVSYTEAKESQVVNTAWALLSLMAAKHPDKAIINQGIQLLIKRQSALGDWAQEGISGVFNYNCMITYSAYRNTFPIWALNRYYNLLLC